MAETSQVQRQIFIEATPNRVFDAWSDPDEIPRWYVERQDGFAERSERITWFLSPEDVKGGGEPLAVRAAERGKKLILENIGDEAWKGTVIDITFETERKGCNLTLIQRNIAKSLKLFAPNVETGWACTLAILKEYIERNGGRKRRVVRAHEDVPPDLLRTAEALRSTDNINYWSGEFPERLLVSTARGAVVAFRGYPGVFTLMGVGTAMVWYTGWNETSLDAAHKKCEQIAVKFAAEIQRRADEEPHN